MKIIITESQLKKVLLEQKKPIPINLADRKSTELIDKYCAKFQVPKEIIDSCIPELKKETMDRIDRKIKEITKDMEVTSMFQKLINKLKNKITPLLINVSSNCLYHQYGYLNYNPNQEVKKILDFAYNEIYKELNTFKFKTLGAVFITKKM